jgi:hypothetical protein
LQFFFHTQKFYFTFQVLPSINPFIFGEDEFNLDDSVSATCSITKGDLPLQIWWTFKSDDQNEFGYNLTTGDGIMITRPSSKISMIAIEALKPRHRGTYECFASNKAGHSVHSAYLSINGSIWFQNYFEAFRILQFFMTFKPFFKHKHF